MPIPPKPLNLRLDSMAGDVPEWTQPVFERLNAFASEVIQAFAATPSVEVAANKSFSTDVTGAAYVDLKNPFSEQPGAVLAGKLTVFHGDTVVTAPYGFAWAMASGSIRCLFTGLSASTKYRFSAAVIQ